MKVAVIGLGKLGSVVATVLVDAGHELVFGVDSNVSTVEALTSGMAVADEPGLQDLLAGVQAVYPDRLRFGTDIAEAVRSTDVAVVIVPTPSGPDGEFDSWMVESVVDEIGKALAWDPEREWYTIVVASTVSPGTIDGRVMPLLAAYGRTVGVDVGLAYMPFFIALGSVIHDLRHPDMVLVGARDLKSYEVARHLSLSMVPGFSALLDAFDDACGKAPTPSMTRILGTEFPTVAVMDFVEAELAKLSLNVALTVKISFANMIGRVSDELGIAAHAVLEAVGLDSRIGSKLLRPGPPPAGPCLPRDVVAMQALAARLGVQVPVADAVEQMTELVLDDIMNALLEDDGGRIAILGLAYKPGSSVTDNALGPKIAHTLSSSTGPTVAVHDPKATFPAPLPDDVLEMGLDEIVQWVGDETPARVLIACPHPEYADLKFAEHVKVIHAWA